MSHPERFLAWLATSSSTAAERFAGSGRWSRLDGIRIAPDLASLASGALDAPLNVDETGAYQGTQMAWTGGAGGPAAETCADWTDGTSAAKGRTGWVLTATSGWDDLMAYPCDNWLALYCLEQ